MSERKVLNKYYPPDFDPSKLRRVKQPKNRQFTVRIMAPFNMRCATCGEYIYKGKKFNARKEDVENEDYLGVRIYRFYIKCTRCLQEISFKTDPRNTDYEMEAGATRNFMALKLAEEKAVKEEEIEKEEEQNNPMKLLENRTKQSKNEIELLESLEELKDLNQRQNSIDYDSMLDKYNIKLQAKEIEKRQQELDEEYIKTVKFESSRKRKIVVEQEIVELEETEPAYKKHTETENLPSSSKSDFKVPETKLSAKSYNPNLIKSKVIGNFTKDNVSGFVKINKPTVTENVKSSGSVSKQKSGLSMLCDYSGSDSE